MNDTSFKTPARGIKTPLGLLEEFTTAVTITIISIIIIQSYPADDSDCTLWPLLM